MKPQEDYSKAQFKKALKKQRAFCISCNAEKESDHHRATGAAALQASPCIEQPRDFVDPLLAGAQRISQALRNCVLEGQLAVNILIINSLSKYYY